MRAPRLSNFPCNCSRTSKIFNNERNNTLWANLNQTLVAGATDKRSESALPVAGRVNAWRQVTIAGNLNGIKQCQSTWDLPGLNTNCFTKHGLLTVILTTDLRTEFEIRVYLALSCLLAILWLATSAFSVAKETQTKTGRAVTIALRRIPEMSTTPVPHSSALSLPLPRLSSSSPFPLLSSPSFSLPSLSSS